MILTLVVFFAGVLPAAQTVPPTGSVSMHVAESRIGSDCSVYNNGTTCKSAQYLSVLIDGKKYEIESETFLPKGIVALGDYKATLVEDEEKPTHEFQRQYELIFPDGSKRKFKVIGVLE